MNRRTFFSAAGALLLAATGCTPKPDRSRVHLVVTTGPDQNGIVGSHIQEFVRLHPGVTGELLELPPSTDTKHNQYATYLIAEDPSIDVFALDVIWPAEFGAAGWALPLEDKIPSQDWDDFLPGPMESCRSEGHTWAIPWYTDAGMLYYRKDILEARGLKPPTTWDELVTVAREARGDKMAGYVGQWMQYEGFVCNLLEFMWGNGGNVLDANGHIVLNSPNNEAAIQFMLDLLLKHQVVPESVMTMKEEESLNNFLGGKSVFMRNWPYAWAQCATSANSTVAGKVGVVAVPRGPMGEKSAVCLGGWNMMVSKYSRHPELAIELARFICSAESQKKSMLRATLLPTRRSCYKDADLLAQIPVLSEFATIFELSRSRPVTPFYSQVSDVLQMYCHQAINQRMTPAQALSSSVTALKSLRGFKNA